MWDFGFVTVNGSVYYYEIKHFRDASEYGIDGGRVSKMLIRKGDDFLVSYDRGWNFKRDDDENINSVYMGLIEKYN